MNTIYDQINLSYQLGEYNFIDFNKESLGADDVNFNLSVDKILLKVRACIDGVVQDIYLDKNSYFMKNKIKVDLLSEDVIHNAHIINDLVIDGLLIDKKEKKYLLALMHLGINKEDYETKLLETAKNFFPKSNLKLKIDFYNELLNKFKTKKEKEILKELTKAIVLEEVDKNGEALKNAPIEFQSDKKIVLRAVKQSGSALYYASLDLKNDKEIVLEAVKQNGSAFFHVSPCLKKDREVILKAIKQNAVAFSYLSSNLKNNIEFILESLTKNYEVFFYLSESLKKNRSILIQVIKQNGLVLSYLSLDLKNDKEIVLEAVKQNEESFNYASENLKKDRSVVLEAVKINGLVLRNVSLDLRKDKEIVLEAVKQFGEVIFFAPDFKNDREVVLAAAIKNEFSFINASLELRKDKEFMKEVLSRNGSVLRYSLEEVKNDPILVLLAVKQNGLAIFDSSEDLKGNREIILEAVKQNGWAFQNACLFLQNDPEILLEASKQIFFQLILEINPNLKMLEYSFIQINQLIEIYVKLKNNKYLSNQEANQYIKAFIDDDCLNIQKYRKHIRNKITKDKSIESNKDAYLLYILSNLEIEANCLKLLNLKQPKVLRIIFPLIKQVLSYRNKEIKEEFISIIKNLSGNSLKLFLEKLIEFTNGRINLILPSILLTKLNISEKTEKELFKILESKTKIFKDQSKPLLQSLIFLEKRIKNYILDIDNEKLANIIKISFCNQEIIEGKNSLVVKDDNDILMAINLITFFINKDSEFIRKIESLSFSNILELVMKPLFEIGILEDNEYVKARFIDNFIKSRIPHAIFTYINKFMDNEVVISKIKLFMELVINGSYLEYRHKYNSYKDLLTIEQKLNWEVGVNKKLNFISSFDSIEFLKSKFHQNHDKGKLNRIKEFIESEAVLIDPSEEEYLCLELINKNNLKDQLDILERLQIVLDSLREYDEIEFKNDVKSQIESIKISIKNDLELDIKDTEDWQDLFFSGTEVLGSCQRIDGNPKYSKMLLGYVLDGKIRMIKISGKDGKTIARSIIKIIKDPYGNPVLLLEKVYPNNKFDLAIKLFVKERAEVLNMRLYEYDNKSSIQLYSEKNVAGFEYEDAGIGITDGKYSLFAKLVE